jgi:hypothetical protein
MSYKTFQNGFPLPASDLNNYLMNQVVATFANSTARASAIASPQEGQVTYLEDTEAYEKWDGSAWVDLFPEAVAATSPNYIINGAFEINQRGFTSTTSSAAFTFDRWTNYVSGGTVTQSAQTFTLGTAPVAGYESRNFLRTAVSGQSASGDAAIVIQNIESVRTLANQQATISFWAKADSGTPKVGVELYQFFGTGGSPSAPVETPIGSVTLSTSWARYSITTTVPSIAGKTIGTNNNDLLAINLWTSAGSTFATRASSIGIQNSTIDIWGVQVEAGANVTPFRRAANTLQGELAACQRYYWRQGAGNGPDVFANFAFGNAKSTTTVVSRVQFPTTMRVAPSAVEFGGSLQVDFGGSGVAVTSLTLGTFNTTLNAASLEANVSSGLTQHRPYYLTAQNSTAAFVAFSAEL